jgi:threonine synthase
MCGASFPLAQKLLVCTKCGGVLVVEYDLNKLKRKSSRAVFLKCVRSLWRYREFLPIEKDESIVSMGEGLTPLLRVHRYASAVGLSKLDLKLDYLNPTGSFKDRGTTVSVSKVRELQVSAVMDDSSGNAGSSLAAYCAAAGLECTLYVPATAPREKLAQAKIYGAKILKIAGSRTDVASAAENAWRTSGTYYASHNLSPFFIEGMKTFAYEIAENLDWQLPDHVVFPVGGGVLLAGACRGFEELLQIGWIERIPRLHCVQSKACMPIVEAFRKGSLQIVPATERETIAGGIRISNPARGAQVLRALQRTKGNVASVSDAAILRHQRLLAGKEGIFAEPTSCAALAGLEKLLRIGVISKHDSVVVALTGFGLKDVKSAELPSRIH